MKVSLQTIQRLVSFELPEINQLVGRINQRLGGVESVTDLSKKYKGAIIVRIISVQKHPNADKLSICLVDDAGAVKSVERNDNGYVQVVCGAPNVRADMFAVWLPPKSVVPATYDTNDPFTLGARELRGVMSNGMLAAADELGIGTDHEGIVELNVDDLPPHVEERCLTAGQDFAELFDLDDQIIDIENKMFTHRPDCFGQLGVAREIAGIYGKRFEDPDWYQELAAIGTPTNSFSFETFNEAGEAVPRFMAVGLDGIRVAPSPFWLQAKLVALGSKPINNVVDITNYVMLMSAQPLHAYDFDKLHGARLGARMARADESVLLLNGKTYQLTTDDIVIADAQGPVGLAGVMGGSESEVSDETTRIVLECATFDMYTVRKSSMRHGVFTDAVARFNKGQSMLMNEYVTRHAVTLIERYAHGNVATDIHDDLMMNENDWRVSPSVKPMLSARDIDRNFITSRLGLDLGIDEIASLLENVGFECQKKDDDKLSYWSPDWRMDIQDKEDVVEEVGRLHGFDNLPLELPTRSIAPAPRHHARSVAEKVRDSLSRTGANEVLTYSFVHENLLKRAGQDPSRAYSLSNALSPSLQYYRLSLMPSLLDKVHPNSKAGHDAFCLFEIGKAHIKDDLDDELLPKEYRRIAGVYASKDANESSPYFMVQRLVRQLCSDFGIESNAAFIPYSSFDAKGSEAFEQLSRPFDPHRSSVLMVDGRPGGVVGELSRSVMKSFKLPASTAGFELFPSLFEQSIVTDAYVPLSKYPSISQDISLRGSAAVSYAEVFNCIKQAAAANELNLRVHVEPVSIYVGDDSSTKTTTFHLTFTSNSRTLTDTDVLPIVETMALRAKDKLALERV